ncbi:MULTISPECIES: LysR family transcriptional regulator [Vibrio]|uniref:Putative LysR family transcriptional regulator n=1 Tax=Vibrio proteolyticus NBRC 13287 TaxID=1219065 RepID=U2ZGC3_VIBPR|nr:MULTISPECIES: LysR family transcriptional regulator [Vibrio]NAX25770.1 LysR family transcriptional regulator [Vibrio sp. V38_P2S17PM301]GAD66731.1 putative LysR family transcriptional regulator [Vibrio proteolyticus NBRC 13287]
MKTINRVIDVKYLRTFSHVVKHKSFTAAAESLFMTQPAVSQHIKKIESVIGASIFDRKEGFGLTKHGKVLLEYADQTMSMYEKLFEDLERVEIRDQFNIAIADSFCPELVERVVREFRGLNNTDLSFTSFGTSTSIDTDKFDLIFSLSRLPEDHGKSYQLNTANYVIAHSSFIDPYDCYPQRIVYCNTLTKSFVQSVLSKNHIDYAHVTSWVTTSSARFMKNELNTNGTVLVCPEWSVRSTECTKIPVRQQVNMYVWCSDEISQELEVMGLRNKIHQMFDQVPSTTGHGSVCTA